MEINIVKTSFLFCTMLSVIDIKYIFYLKIITDDIKFLKNI